VSEENRREERCGVSGTRISGSLQRLLLDFEDAVRRDEMKGGGDPESIPEIEGYLRASRAALYSRLRSLEQSANLPLDRSPVTAEQLKAICEFVVILIDFANGDAKRLSVAEAQANVEKHIEELFTVFNLEVPK
jgi:hypothetical protein